MKKPRILILNGANLNMIGKREPEHYGSVDMKDIREKLESEAREAGLELLFQQSNHEGDLIDILQKSRGKVDLAIINPGGFTHYSVSLRDAVLASEIPFIEVHLSNISAREPFRQQSLFSDIAEGIIIGFQENSYLLALKAASDLVKNRQI